MILSSLKSLTIMKRINRSINSSIISSRTSIRSSSISSSISNNAYSIGINNIKSINNNSNNSNSRCNINSRSVNSSSSSNSSRIFRRYFSVSYQTIGMPSLSPTMTHGTIASWQKKPGNIL